MIQIFCQRQWLEKRRQKLKTIVPTVANMAASSNANMAASSDAGTIVPTVARSGVTDRMQDKSLEFYQEEMTDNPVLEPNEEGFNWDNEVIRENEFELVDDTMEISPIVADNENPIEGGDEGYDTEQEYDMQEIEKGFGYGLNLEDQSDEDGY